MEGRIVIRNTWQPHTNDGEPPCPLNHGLYFTFKKQTIHYLTEEIPKKSLKSYKYVSVVE